MADLRRFGLRHLLPIGHSTTTRSIGSARYSLWTRPRHLSPVPAGTDCEKWGKAVSYGDVPWPMALRQRASVVVAGMRPTVNRVFYCSVLFLIAVLSFECGKQCGYSREPAVDLFPATATATTAEEAVTIVEGRLFVDASLTRDLGVPTSAVCGLAHGWPEFRLARFEPVSGVWIVPCEIQVMPRADSRPTNYRAFFAVDSGDGVVERLNVPPNDRRSE